jgi:hypothetical protein
MINVKLTHDHNEEIDNGIKSKNITPERLKLHQAKHIRTVAICYYLSK